MKLSSIVPGLVLMGSVVRSTTAFVIPVDHSIPPTAAGLGPGADVTAVQHSSIERIIGHQSSQQQQQQQQHHHHHHHHMIISASNIILQQNIREWSMLIVVPPANAADMKPDLSALTKEEKALEKEYKNIEKLSKKDAKVRKRKRVFLRVRASVVCRIRLKR